MYMCLDPLTKHFSNALQHSAAYCNTLQHTATHCSTHAHVSSTPCRERARAREGGGARGGSGEKQIEREREGQREQKRKREVNLFQTVFQCLAVCCKVLQCVAVSHSMLQCAATRKEQTSLKLPAQRRLKASVLQQIKQTFRGGRRGRVTRCLVDFQNILNSENQCVAV